MRGYTLRRLLWVGPFATILAIGANFVYYRVTQAMGEPYLLPLDASGSQSAPMPAVFPILGALALGLLATLFFGLILRSVRKPATVFLSVGVTALILSFGGSFSMPGAELRTKLFLSGMNVVTGLVLVGGILLLGREKNPI